jgi:predicted transglutaminase-like cysteine proteinase
MLALLLALQLGAAEAASVPVYYAWLEHCGRTQDPGCRVERVTAHDLAWVNAVVNRGMSPRDDPGPDVWTAFPADRRGDCDDYVLSKRAALLALGLAPSAMTIVAGRDGEIPHLVLEATIEGRTWVLDNKTTDELYAPGAASYAWRETARQPRAGVIWTTPHDSAGDAR